MNCVIRYSRLRALGCTHSFVEGLLIVGWHQIFLITLMDSSIKEEMLNRDGYLVGVWGEHPFLLDLEQIGKTRLRALACHKLCLGFGRSTIPQVHSGILLETLAGHNSINGRDQPRILDQVKLFSQE